MQSSYNLTFNIKLSIIIINRETPENANRNITKKLLQINLIVQIHKKYWSRFIWQGKTSNTSWHS